jgi:signal transduction histidine kinase
MRTTLSRPRRLVAFASCTAFAVAASTAVASLTIESISVDGGSIDLSSQTVTAAGSSGGDQPMLQLPAGTQRLEIRYAGQSDQELSPDAFGLVRGTRLRHRLDGVDDDWRDAPASGRVLLQFLDEADTVIDSVETSVCDESPGWQGSLERSPGRDYRFVATAPPRAEHVTAHFLSHGTDHGREVVGQISIDDVVITVTPREGEPEEHPLPITGPPDSDVLSSTPAGWTRRGSWGWMAQVREGGPPTRQPVLAIIDDDPDQYGNWSSLTRVPVKPGDKVTLTWRSAHSLGLGGSVVATYRDLTPGQYWFRAGTFRPAGEPTGEEISLGIEVVVPWYARSEVLLAGLAVGLGLAAALGRSVALTRIKRRLEALQRDHALERERMRIARDLHDEVGASLTEIAMQQYWVQREMEDTAAPATLARVERSRQSVVELVRNVDAIVWAVNPANDTLDRFVPYLTHAVEQFLEAAGVTARIDTPDNPPPLPIDGRLRHGLFLTVREAVNNAVRHGRPTTVWLSIVVDLGRETARLLITVDDDGTGITPAEANGGRGLGIESMRRRMHEARGVFAIVPRPGGGTRVSLEVPMAGRMS